MEPIALDIFQEYDFPEFLGLTCDRAGLTEEQRDSLIDLKFRCNWGKRYE